MKNLLIFLVTSIMVSCSNNNDEKPKTELEKLPPATQTGKNKFGCLIDGKAFTPDNAPNSTNCFYQLVNGEYYFNVSAARDNINSGLIGIALKTEKKQIEEGSTYNLVEPTANNVYGLFSYGFLYYTSQINTGTLTITKLSNQIVSGTFSYDVADSNGVIHKIREGRFDFQYTN